MTQTIFYSWAADHEGKVQRHFIREALRQAVQHLNTDVVEADRFDLTSDTQDVAGSPSIFPTIKSKILACDIFVGDLTPAIVPEGASGRAYPNPNVLIEYGIAEAILPEERVIFVSNAALNSCRPEQYPFNLRHRRAPLSYSLPMGSDSKQRSRCLNDFSTRLAAAIQKSILSRGPNRDKNENDLSDWQKKVVETPLFGIDRNVAKRKLVVPLPGTENRKISMSEGSAQNYCYFSATPNYDLDLTKYELRARSNITYVPYTNLSSGNSDISYSGFVAYWFDGGKSKEGDHYSDALTMFGTNGRVCGVNTRICSNNKISWLIEDFFAWASRFCFDYYANLEFFPIYLEFGVVMPFGSEFSYPAQGGGFSLGETIEKNEIKMSRVFSSPNVDEFLMLAKEVSKRIWLEAGIVRPDFLDDADERKGHGITRTGYW
ncbi:hypothetical protein HH303_04925 [Rhodospirillaceae bacterium KN72]|uniref:CD-NTase-associated protein 12/Pycsar effector protein TIR domain-containing protein n=1 Tax=Pacificispira spongiicola TaxID=2729598 RepID=A0A7Y0HEQ3_9PROT|nr:hypothetical protein [Pacificispira spongiicola]NMM43808.1 hypothetical protein [Pacificispira spongiicola]